MTCPQLVDSGVYVLGALAPAQRAAFERHMATCAECQAEVNDLAVLPGLLGRLDEPSLHEVELPPPTVLPGVLARVHRQRRGRRLLAGAAALVVAALALIAGLNMPSSTSVPPPVVAASSPAAVPLLHPMLAVTAAVPVTAQVGFTSVTGGTQLELKCQYPESYGKPANVKHWFVLYAIPRNGGTPQQLSNWGATRGEDVVVPAVTSWSMAELSRLELRDSSGKTLLYYNITT